MFIKRISFALVLIIIIGFYACDKVDGPKREMISIDTTCHFASDNSIPFKKTLMVEFTGHLCGNCPAASIYLSDTIKPKYNDSLVIVSVHSGYFAAICTSSTGACPGGANDANFLTDFTCTASNDWYAYYGIAANPKGVVDGTAIASYQSWDGAIESRLQVAAKVRIKIANTYSAADRKVRACIETKFLSNVSEDYKLAVLLTEDSIVDYQEWYGHNPQYYADYVHRHVLRAAFNTSLGVPIASDTTTANTAITSGYSVILDPSWNVDHCAVVAFVYKVSNKEVVQVEEAKIQ